MINRHVHMRDQVTNRIEMIMQEGRFSLSLMRQLEELSIVVLLVAVFVVGVGL
jgi:hypothetical protein